MTQPTTRHPRDADDDVWEGLTHGTLSKDEEAVLRALAEESEDDATRFRAHAPLDETFRARVTERLVARIDADKKVRKLRRWMGGAGLSMAAAAALLMLGTPTKSSLPPYVLSVQGADATTRGGDRSGAEVRLAADAVLTLIARPDRRVRGPVTASVFAIRRDRYERLDASLEVDESGAVRAEISGAALPFSGQSALTLAMVIAEAPPTEQEARDLVISGDPRALVTHVVPSGR
jgi:hypothetical protein